MQNLLSQKNKIVQHKLRPVFTSPIWGRPGGGHEDEDFELNPQNQIEQNTKDINRIYLVNINHLDSLSYSDSLTVMTIANECPSEFGPAVFQARMISVLMGNQLIMTDECPGGGNRNSKPNVKSRVNCDCHLSPNPASGGVFLECKMNCENEMTINLTDALGRLVLTRNLIKNEGVVQIDISWIRPGIYFYTIYSAKLTDVVSGKLIISK